MNARIAAALLGFSTLAAAAPSAAAPGALTGKMAAYSYLIGGPWVCKAAGATYTAVYAAAPGNKLHGMLSSPQDREDQYIGVTGTRYFIVSADSNGATESQSSADGITFTGKLNDGAAITSATNVMRKVTAVRWTMDARGVMGGKPYDFVATCDRHEIPI